MIDTRADESREYANMQREACPHVVSVLLGACASHKQPQLCHATDRIPGWPGRDRRDFRTASADQGHVAFNAHLSFVKRRQHQLFRIQARYIGLHDRMRQPRLWCMWTRIKTLPRDGARHKRLGMMLKSACQYCQDDSASVHVPATNRRTTVPRNRE
jgi:hypothetical protein